MRRHLETRLFGCALIFGLACGGKAAEKTEGLVELPAIKVGAGVPLTKVAEYEMREKRLGAASVANKDFIYIIGGLVTNGTATNSVERFDVHTGRTEMVARLRVARFWHHAVLVGQKIYVLGGVRPDEMGRVPTATGRVDVEASVEIIDLATGTVSRGPAMPDPRYEFGCVESGGEIFVLGGARIVRDHHSYTNTTEILDVAKGEWRKGVPMPTPKAADAAVVDGGVIVVAGGYNGTMATAAVDAFDLRAGTWRTLPPLCRSTAAHAMVFLGDFFFLFGDYEEPERLLAYNLKTKQSETYTLRYTPARHATAVVADDRIFVIGGRREKQLESLSTIQVFKPTAPARPNP